MTAQMTQDKVRLDRWLWAARLFKTRSLAAQAIDGGKVQVNGARVKRSTAIHAGDTVRITKPPFELTAVVRALSEHRGSASVAETLYDETPASREAREQLRLQLKYQPRAAYEGRGRPTKKDRRDIDRFKREG
jgi:ribosome-associated heat shock protein Hsp15